MLSFRSRRVIRQIAAITGITLVATAASLDAQDFTRVLSSEFTMSGSNATMSLELEGGRNIELAIRNGGVFIDGARVGDAARGSTLDRAWRDLLTQAMDASPAELPRLLTDWSASGNMGARLDAALEAALRPAAPAAAPGAPAQVTPGAPVAPVAPVAPGTPGSDSVHRLVERIDQLQREVDRLESRGRVVVERPARPVRRQSPFRHITEGLGGIFSIIVSYTVLFGIGFVAIMFGGRKYIEGVADTARHATGRSFLVGLAAAFLIVPTFVLGIIALAISVVGIPGLLVWVPGFPVAAVIAVLLGYLGVAHAAGEAFAERRFYVADWFQRGNSYYFLISGIGLLLALFLAGMVVHMAGPWLRPISVILMTLGSVLTIAAATIGFGAVLVSHAGKKPVRANGSTSDLDRDLFTEEAGV